MKKHQPHHPTNEGFDSRERSTPEIDIECSARQTLSQERRNSEDDWKAGLPGFGGRGTYISASGGGGAKTLAGYLLQLSDESYRGKLPAPERRTPRPTVAMAMASQAVVGQETGEHLTQSPSPITFRLWRPHPDIITVARRSWCPHHVAIAVSCLPPVVGHVAPSSCGLSITRPIGVGPVSVANYEA
ncbi:hypothetical protein NL676_011797 [Syzygium grande]|nr:hypothetical protein NL676_011797 [Syzygium grande]